MRYRDFLSALAASMFAPICSAQATVLDDLRNARFGDTGTLRRVDCPIGGRYDCLSFPSRLYELNNTCFTLEAGSFLSGYEDAMMIEFRAGTMALVVKSGIGRKFEVIDIESIYKCPDLF